VKDCNTVDCYETKGSHFCETCADYTRQIKQIKWRGIFNIGECITITLMAIMLTAMSPIGLIAWIGVIHVWENRRHRNNGD
jgi:hypothetical protein